MNEVHKFQYLLINNMYIRTCAQCLITLPLLCLAKWTGAGLLGNVQSYFTFLGAFEVGAAAKLPFLRPLLAPFLAAPIPQISHKPIACMQLLYPTKVLPSRNFYVF